MRPNMHRQLNENRQNCTNSGKEEHRRNDQKQSVARFITTENYFLTERQRHVRKCEKKKRSKFNRLTSCNVMTSSFFVNVNVSFGSMQHFFGLSRGAIKFFGIEKLAVFRSRKLIIVASNSPVSLSYSNDESLASSAGDRTNSPVSLSFSVAAIVPVNKDATLNTRWLA